MFLPFRSIDIIDKLYPKKLAPVSPINVFAGLKLNGKNPKVAPDKADIRIIAAISAPFKAKIIRSDTVDIPDIPADRPSKPSIKFIAFVTPTIQQIVNNIDIISGNSFICKNGIVTCSILIPP